MDSNEINRYERLQEIEEQIGRNLKDAGFINIDKSTLRTNRCEMLDLSMKATESDVVHLVEAAFAGIPEIRDLSVSASKRLFVGPSHIWACSMKYRLEIK